MKDVAMYFILQASGDQDHQINYLASNILLKEFSSQFAEQVCCLSSLLK